MLISASPIISTTVEYMKTEYLTDQKSDPSIEVKLGPNIVLA